MISIDDKVMFDPFECITGFASADHKDNTVTGVVTFVNYGHKWFSVEYGDPKLRASFQFWDIGKSVKICGH